MKAYVTSIGEVTTDLCVWALERNGFEVILLLGTNTSLWHKLKQIYEMADDDFIRVDADVVVNKNLTVEMIKSIREQMTHEYWYQFQCYGWFKQDLIWGGVQFYRKESLPALRENIDSAEHDERPETTMSRIKDFHNPRRFQSLPFTMCVGIHGFAAKDIDRVKQTKLNRNQYHSYDWGLAEKLERLMK